MKTINILFASLLLAVITIFAQTKDNEKKEVYPDKYTFEKADEFQKKGEYDKAIWFYINLFPENKTIVTDIIKKIALKLDTVDTSWFIKKSFTNFGSFDPEITTIKDGILTLDKDKLKNKGAWCDELIKTFSESNNTLNTASKYNDNGLAKYKANDFNGAIEEFNKAIDINPTGQIYFNRGYAKSEIGDYKGAVQDYDKTIEFKYRLVEVYFERGYNKDQLTNYEGAIQDYTNAIEIKKDYVDAYNNRAYVKLKKKDYEAAITDFDKAINLKPDYAAAFLNRGFAKKMLGDLSGACKDWTKAFELGLQQANEFIKDNCK
jgi:tetratricopeptide (TPR) repeat protein